MTMSRAEAFEECVQELYDDSPRSEQLEINRSVDFLVDKLKAGHPGVQVSSNSVLVGVMAAMYYMQQKEAINERETA